MHTRNNDCRKAVAAMEAELNVLKFSLDAMDDDEIKSIRGKKANYDSSIKNFRAA